MHPSMMCWDCSTGTGSVSYNDMLGLFYRDRSVSFNDIVGLLYRDREFVLQYVGIVLQRQEVCLAMLCWDCSTGTWSLSYNDMLGLCYKDRECVLQ